MEELYNFATAIEGLKKLERFRGQCFWKDYPFPTSFESVADHSWRLAVLVMMIAPKLSEPFQTEKAIKMALIHDLPEIITGDESPLDQDGTGKSTHAYDETLAAQKHAREKIAAQDLFGLLPVADAQSWFDLWNEAEENKTFEARVVKALDKLECTLQVLEYRDGHMFKDHFAFSVKYGMKYADVDPAIRAFGEEITRRMQEKFREYRP